jgi:hypothetical protein
MTACNTITRSPIVFPGGRQTCYERIGLLKSFANRWRDNSYACRLVPFDRFVTGRIPNIQEYPFPYMSLLIPSGSGHGRSDRSTWFRRVAVVHVWVDMGRMEEGEAIAEELREIYCNQAWRYDYGDVIDVLDHGPPQIMDVNEPTFQYHEIIKTMTLCGQQRRVDSCNNICVPQPCASSCQPASSSSSFN